jgi:hypothetical protein
MKTLSDLKRNCANYNWSLQSNSFYAEVPDHQKSYRRVSCVQSTKFALETRKDEHMVDSWVNFPKASELTITPSGNHFIVTINRALEGNFSIPSSVHTMIYLLQSN